MKVPQIEPTGGNPGALPITSQSVRGLDADAFGGVAARQTGQLAKGLGNLATATDQILQIQAADEVTKRETDLQTRINLRQADNARNRRGDKAIGLTAENEAWYKEQRQEIEGKITNPLAARAFARVADRTAPSLTGWSRRFENEQSLVALKATTEANNEALVGRAITDPSPENIAEVTRSLRRNAATIAAAAGLTDPDVVNQAALAQTTRLHVGVFAKLVDADQAEAADAYLSTHADDIAPTTLTDLREKLATVKQDTLVQTEARGFHALGDEAKALAAVDAKFGEKDGALASKIRAEVKTRFAEDQRQRAQAQRDHDESMLKGYMVDGVMPTRSQQLRMSASAVNALQAEIQQKRAGSNVATDWKVYVKLRDMARDDPEAFAKENLFQYFPSLDASKREQLLDLQQSVKKGGKELQRVVTLEQQLAAAHRRMKWQGDANAQKRGLFDTAVYAEIEQMAPGKPAGWKPSYDDVEAIIKRKLVQTDGGWFGADEYAFQREARGETPAGEEVRVPEAEAAKITAAYRRRYGKDPDEAEVVNAYLRQTGLR